MTVVNIKNLVKDLSFESVKEIAENSNLKVKYTDDLYLLSVTNDNDIETPIQNEANGLILEKDTNNIVCMCDNKMKDFTEDVFDKVKKVNVITMEYCEDGTVIRLYNYKGTWYTATTKCIDATKSFWSSESTFDSMFWESCGFNEEFTKEMMLKSLDVNFTYIFILLHPDNRIVVKHEEKRVMFIKRINNKTQEYDYLSSKLFYGYEGIFNLPQHIVPNGNKLTINELNTKYYNSNKRGIIIKINFVSYKYDFEKYSKVKNIRGNVPLIRNRYLELLCNQQELELLKVYYPEHHLLFSMINHSLDNLYKNVHKLYIDSHVKHNIMVTENHEYNQILKQLHGIYKKQNVIITLEEVKKKINSLPVYVIKKLLHFV
jgi:hypothetical protein